MDGKKRRIRLV